MRCPVLHLLHSLSSLSTIQNPRISCRNGTLSAALVVGGTTHSTATMGRFDPIHQKYNFLFAQSTCVHHLRIETNMHRADGRGFQGAPYKGTARQLMAPPLRGGACRPLGRPGDKDVRAVPDMTFLDRGHELTRNRARDLANDELVILHQNGGRLGRGEGPWVPRLARILDTLPKIFPG